MPRKAKPYVYKPERDRSIDEGREWVQRITDRTGWAVEWRNPNAPEYQLARVSGPGFCMVVYPHKTSAGNHHMRLRDQGSKDKEAYRKAVEEFYIKTGNNCSFQTKYANETISPAAFLEACNYPSTHEEK
jgi:hypothetical protein